MDLVTKLGFGKKMQDGKLTADDQKQLFAEYEKEYGVSFKDDKEADEDADDDDNHETELSAEEQQELAALLPEETPIPKTAKNAVGALSNTVKNKNQVIEQKDKTIQELSGKPEDGKPIDNVKPSAAANANIIARTLGLTPSTSTHLFGIEDDMFSLENWYTNLTLTRQPVIRSLEHDDEQLDNFKDAFNGFAKALISRSNDLNSKNLLGSLNYKKMLSGESLIDYSDLFDKAGEYIVRRTDLILAYLRSLPSVSHIFPVVSNVQNKEVAPGANFGELSQGYRKGEIYKGNVHFTAEIYHVNDIMFKFLFEDLIELEKQYIGYLNREGSDVIKWTFIEWIMVHFGTILRNEENVRRVAGIRIPQQNVVSNPALFAADGAYRAVERVEEELKVYPNMDYKVYDESTIVDYYEGFWDFYSQILPSMVGYKMYANLRHRPWYIRRFREKYGKDTDFTGVNANSINDVDANIIWVPNLPMNNYKLIITPEGNIENLEDKPNEMLKFYFERNWEEVGVMSRWKGGSGVRQAGIQFASLKELRDSEYEYQWLFTNFPATVLSADATTINAKQNSLFLTGENTAAAVIDKIENFRVDTVIKIVCGSMNNPSTIDKTGIFAKIDSKFEAKAEGDWIKVYPELEDYEVNIDGKTITKTRATGNFLELARSVSA